MLSAISTSARNCFNFHPFNEEFYQYLCSSLLLRRNAVHTQTPSKASSLSYTVFDMPRRCNKGSKHKLIKNCPPLSPMMPSVQIRVDYNRGYEIGSPLPGAMDLVFARVGSKPTRTSITTTNSLVKLSRKGDGSPRLAIEYIHGVHFMASTLPHLAQTS